MLTPPAIVWRPSLQGGGGREAKGRDRGWAGWGGGRTVQKSADAAHNRLEALAACKGGDGVAGGRTRAGARGEACTASCRRRMGACEPQQEAPLRQPASPPAILPTHRPPEVRPFPCWHAKGSRPPSHRPPHWALPPPRPPAPHPPTHPSQPLTHPPTHPPTHPTPPHPTPPEVGQLKVEALAGLAPGAAGGLHQEGSRRGEVLTSRATPAVAAVPPLGRQPVPNTARCWITAHPCASANLPGLRAPLHIVQLLKRDLRQDGTRSRRRLGAGAATAAGQGQRRRSEFGVALGPEPRGAGGARGLPQGDTKRLGQRQRSAQAGRPQLSTLPPVEDDDGAALEAEALDLGCLGTKLLVHHLLALQPGTKRDELHIIRGACTD